MRTLSLPRFIRNVEKPYVFQDEKENVVPMPTDIESLARRERQLNSLKVEMEAELHRITREKAEVCKQLYQARERIADFARQHGCRSEPVTEVDDG